MGDAPLLGWQKSYISGKPITSLDGLQDELERHSIVFVLTWNRPVHKGWLEQLKFKEVARMLKANSFAEAVKKVKNTK